MSYTRYLKQLSIITVALLFCMVLLNLIADPLAIYRLVNKPGFNQAKTRLSAYSRVAKPIWMDLYDYQRIAFGSSRTEIGIPMYGTAWDQQGEQAMNAAVSGANITTVAQLFRHATEVTNMKSAVVGLDFFMFNAYNNGGYSHPQLLAPQNSSSTRLLRAAELSLFSQDILQASIRTLRKQSADDDKYHLSGQMNNERETLRALKKGYPNIFAHFEDGFFRTTWTPCKNSAFVYENDQTNTFEILNRILLDAGEKGVELRFYIAPIHAHLLEALDAAGLWQEYERWKQLLVMKIESAQQTQPALDVQLWDFSGYHRYATEKLPPVDGRTRMQGYIDSSHFSEYLGKRILDRIFTPLNTEDFGIQLNSRNISQVLQQTRIDQRQFRSKYPAIYQHLQQRAQKFATQRLRNGRDCSH